MVISCSHRSKTTSQKPFPISTAEFPFCLSCALIRLLKICFEVLFSWEQISRGSQHLLKDTTDLGEPTKAWKSSLDLTVLGRILSVCGRWWLCSWVHPNQSSLFAFFLTCICNGHLDLIISNVLHKQMMSFLVSTRVSQLPTALCVMYKTKPLCALPA